MSQNDSRLSGRFFCYEFGHRDSIMKLLRWECKQANRDDLRRAYQGRYAWLARVPGCCAILAGIARAGRNGL